MASPLDPLRQSVPWMKDLSDEEILDKTSRVTGKSVQDIADYYGMTTGRDRGAGMAGLRSGWEGLKGIGYGGIGATADVADQYLGVPGADVARDWANKQAARRSTAGQLESRPDLENVEDVYDKPSKYLDYGIYQIANQVPQFAGAMAATALTPELAVPAWIARGGALLPKVLGGGGAWRAGMTAAEKLAAEKAGMTFGKSLLGGGAFNEGQAVGSLYNEGVEGGNVHAGGEAFAKSLPYAGAETLPEAMLAGRFLHGSGLKGNIARRMGISGAVSGTAGGTSEVLQTGLEHSMHPEGQITPEQSRSDYINAGVTGTLVEGILGSLGGIRGHHRAPLDTRQPADLTKRLPTEAYDQQVERAYGLSPGDLGLRTPEQQAALDAHHTDLAARNLEAQLVPQAPVAPPTYTDDYAGQMERAHGLPPGSLTPPPPPAAPPAGPAPGGGKAAPVVDPVLAQITDTNLQLRDPYVESHLAPDHTKTPNQIRAFIRTLVGDPQTMDEAKATLKQKIIATLAPASGKGSRAERDERAGKMIYMYDTLVGTPDAERRSVDDWRTGLQAESERAAQAAALANAKVGQEGQVPGPVTSIDPATLNTPPVGDNTVSTGAPTLPHAPGQFMGPAAPDPAGSSGATGSASPEAIAARAAPAALGVPPNPQSPAQLPAYPTDAKGVPVKPTSKEEVGAYQEAMQAFLKTGVAEADMQHLLATRGKEAVAPDSPVKVEMPSAKRIAEMQKTPDGRRELARLAELSAQKAELPAGEAIAAAPGAGSLRGTAKTLGVAHTTLADSLKRARKAIAANAKAAGISEDVAHELLGLQSSFDVIDSGVRGTGTGGTYEAGQRVNVDDRVEGVQDESDVRHETVAPEASTEQVPAAENVEGEQESAPAEGAPVASDAEAAAPAKPRVEFENKWVDALGQPISHADVRDAQEDYDRPVSEDNPGGRAASEPTWDQLTPQKQLQWVKGYLGALVTFPKKKQEAERQQRHGLVREAMFDGEEQGTDEGNAGAEGDGAGADRQAKEGAVDAGGTQGVGREVAGVSAGVPKADQGGVPPAAGGRAEGATGQGTAVAGEARPVAQAAAEVAPGEESRIAPGKAAPVTTKKTRKAAPPAAATTKLETSSERAQRKWDEAAQVVPKLGKWSDLSKAAQDSFASAEEKDQKIADAVKVKEADKPADDVQRSERKRSPFTERVAKWAKQKWGERVAPNGKKIADNFMRWFGDSMATDSESPTLAFHGTVHDFTEFKNGWSAKLATALGFHFAVDPVVASNITNGYDAKEADPGSHVMPVYLKIENPLVITGKGSDDTEVAKAVLRHSMTPEYLHAMLTGIGHTYNLDAAKTMMQRWADGKTVMIGQRQYTKDGFIDDHTTASMNPQAAAAIKGVVDKFVKESGYDGIIYKNTSPMETRGAQDKAAYIAFKPEQVKSAVGNNGNFSETEPDIRRSEQSERTPRKDDTSGRKGATTVAHATNTLKRLFFSNSRFDQKVTIVQSAADLPGDMVERYKIGPHTQAFVEPKTEHVYLIADNVDKGSELGVFLHEMGTHVGMEKLIGKENMVALAKKIADWSELNDGSPHSIIANAVMQRLDDAIALADARGQTLNEHALMQETIAYFVEEAVDHGINPTAVDATSELGRWFRTLWASVKVGLRKMGLGRFDSLTPHDIVNLAYGAARLELEGNWHGTAALFRKFSHAFMGTGEGAQAYGWGTYLAQRVGIAKDYWTKDVARKARKASTKTTPGYMQHTYDGQVVNMKLSNTDPVLRAKQDLVMQNGGIWFSTQTPQEEYAKQIEAEQKFRKIWDNPEKTDREKFYEAVAAEFAKLDPAKVSSDYIKGQTIRTPSGFKATYAGKEVKESDTDPVERARYDSAMYNDGLHSLDPKADYANRLMSATSPEEIAFWTDAGKALNTIDDSKLSTRGSNAGIMGSLMRVDVGVADNEWLDLDLPLSDQSKLVQDAIKTLLPDARAEVNGEKLYHALTAKLGSKKAASEALDKAGVKGNRFLDAQSRTVSPDIAVHQGPARLVAPRLVGTTVGWFHGKIEPNTPISWTPKTGEIRVNTGNGWKVLSRPGVAHPDHMDIARALKANFPLTDIKRNVGATRNFVVFNDKNIFRVASHIGAEPDNVQFSEKRRLPPAAAKAKTNTEAFAQKHGLGVMITEDIADMATQAGLPEVRQYVNIAKEREAERVAFEVPVSKVTGMYDALPERERGTGAGSVNKFIHDATLRGNLDGIDRLSASGQALVKAVFKHGKDTLALKKKLIDDEVGREYDNRIAEETEESKKAELRAERATVLKKFSKLLTVQDSDTYAPLKRFGDFVVSAKSLEYVAAEDAKNQKWISENQSNPAHLQVHFAETQGEADALEAEIKRDPNFKGGKTYAAAREADMRNHRDLFRAFPVLQTRLAAEYPTEGVSPMARIIRDLYLQALAENSARKGEMQRRGIAGASTDMMRAFNTQGRADAAFLSNLKHNDALQNAVQAMRDGAERDRRKLTPYLNEMLLRHAASYEQHTARWSDKLKRASSMWMLSTNPTYYLQQLVQPWSMSLPVIAGTHGYFRTARALRQGYTDMATTVKGTGLTGTVDWTHAPADVRDMLTTLGRNGAIDATNSMDQGEWELADKGRYGAAWNRVDAKLRGLNTRVEAINRAVTAMAAYRMELARNGGNKAAATDYAERMVRQTHGSYDGSNTPRYMQSPVAQVLTQFRRFQVIQLSLIARLAHNALKGSTPQERAIARRALTYTLLHTGALGGALGMPGAALVTSLVARLFGPSDEPPDFEKEARELIGDQLVSDLLLKGVPAMLGVDLSSKLGMGQILSVAPFADFPTDRKSAEKYVTAALGPATGLGLKVVDGLDQMYKGNVAKGAEQLLPTGFANAMKAHRLATEGVSMRSGDTILSKDEIGLADTLLQGLGMPSTTITRPQQLGQTKYEFDTYYKDRATDLVRDFQRARKDGEPTTDVMAEWRDLQDARVRNGYARQPVSFLLKSAQTQAKRERATAGGVEFTKANKRFVQDQANL